MNNNLNVTLSENESLNVNVPDINYIPGYKQAEEERRTNENIRINNENRRENYYETFKSQVESGNYNGATFLPSVDDNGNISWSNDKGLVNPTTKNIKGPKGDQGIQGPQGPQGEPGQIRMLILTSLPVTGEEGVLYFVPKTPDTQDLYDEYAWINNAWELLGEKRIEVDLTDYVKNTDYANATTGGVVKIDTDILRINNSGCLSPQTKSYSGYLEAKNSLFISKYILENVISGKGLVSDEDYATTGYAGVIKADTTYGYNVNQLDGSLYCMVYSYSQYDSKDSTSFISKGTLENVLNARIGDIATVLDTIQGEVI